MDCVAALLDTTFNGEERGDYRMVAFALFVFPWGEPDGPCNYVSNAPRSDVAIVLKRQLRADFEDTS